MHSICKVYQKAAACITSFDSLCTHLAIFIVFLGPHLQIIMHDLNIKNILRDDQDRRLTDVASLTAVQLKAELQHRGLPATGKKAALVQRLKEAIGENTLVHVNIMHLRLLNTYHA